MRFRWLLSLILLGATLLTASPPVHAQVSTGNLTTAAAGCGNPPANSTGDLFANVGSTGGAAITLSGTWSGTVSFFGSGNGGVTWDVITSLNNSGASTATANGTWQFNPTAYGQICAAFTTATSGTVVATIRLSPNSAGHGGGGGGGSGTVSGQASGVIPLATGSTTIGAQSALSDNGTTVSSSEPVSVAGSGTFTGGLSSAADGVHAGNVTLVGNTANPAVASNTFNLFGPATATFTAYALQFPNAAPAANTGLCAGAPSSSVSQITYCGLIFRSPASTAANTITTASGVVGLTINGVSNTTAANFSIVNQFGNATWDSGGNETTNGSVLFSYAGNHIDGGGSTNDISGTVAVASSTTGAVSFTQGYTNAPACTLTPQADPTAVGVYWVTTTTAAITAHTKISGTLSFTYHCFGAPN